MYQQNEKGKEQKSPYSLGIWPDLHNSIDENDLER